MRRFKRYAKQICFLLAGSLLSVSVSACALFGPETAANQNEPEKPDETRFLSSIEDEPDTVDFQCTTIHYTIATNVFNRLVEMESDGESDIQIIPSLAESWEISEEGRVYTFHLRDGIHFSNGSLLTSSDVLYTLVRLLTHPDSCNKDIAEVIVGSDELEQGKTDTLAGFEILSDLDFSITLEEPFEAFLACLSMPGASILDEESTEEAGERFGKVPEYTIGTGPFILWKWEPGVGMKLIANKDCWEGAPACEGLNLLFMSDPDEIRLLFEKGGIDILNLDEVGNSAEYFMHGDIYQDRLYAVNRLAITYVALNESIRPFNDVRVRKALQLLLNRSVLLDAVYSGRGSLENGIFPHGLYGFNPELPEIPYDPEEAQRLLKEAGYENGFDLTISVNASSSTQNEMALIRLIASMWNKGGVRTDIEMIDGGEFMSRRKTEKLACYSAMWTADYNDPDNFIFTFYGTKENTQFRSLCYPRQEIMDRVRLARRITDPEARLKEYRDLEAIIVQEDCAWIPLFSRLQYYVTSERVNGFYSIWNGSVKNVYRKFSIQEPAETEENG